MSVRSDRKTLALLISPLSVNDVTGTPQQSRKTPRDALVNLPLPNPPDLSMTHHGAFCGHIGAFQRIPACGSSLLFEA